MDLFNLTGSEIAAVLTILVLTIVLIVFIVLGLKEKKKITEVTLKNMDFVMHPILTFTSSTAATIEDQTFQTPFGPVFMSNVDSTIKADKTSAVLVQVQRGPTTFDSSVGGALTLAVTNRTKNPLIVEGGAVVTALSGDKTTTAPTKAFLGGITPVTVPASESKNATLAVVGGNVTSDLGAAMFAVTLSSAVQALPTLAENDGQ
uniref:Wsv311-like protein n=1 Tax=Hemigrapsus takanoi nimavirus TaxID=2133792 RepID=A0A401IP00_9VIRU|nr:MAG: wsv311-like protein [Hemigrapsus takanoi nimavirus]GBG35348.1 wsv311-like protein [Hemigrapsus takanoi nimavirus]